MSDPRFPGYPQAPQQVSHPQTAPTGTYTPVAPQMAAYAPPPPPAPAGGLHFLEAAGHIALAGLHFLSGGSTEEEQEEAPQRRRRPSRVGTGSCCRVKRPVK